MSSIRELLTAVGERMQLNFEKISAQLPQPGEKGGAREEAVRQFLRDYLPGRVGVGDGTIIDHQGATSPQCDVVLYDTHSTPVFRVSESKQFFPAETTLMAIEIKSTLTRAELEDAIDKGAKVARLSRTAEKEPQPLIAGVPFSNLFKGALKATFDPGVIGCGIFGYDSPSLKTLTENLLELVVEQKLRPREWPFFVASLSAGFIMYGRDTGENGLTLQIGANNADALIVVEAEDDHPLLLFFLSTLAGTQQVVSARLNPIPYLALSGRARVVNLPSAPQA